MHNHEIAEAPESADSSHLSQPIRRLFVSVTDTTGLSEFLQQLQSLVPATLHLVASDGTAAFLREHGFSVVSVSEYTGSPAILGGRVKTLHPRVHAGLLARGAVDAPFLADAGLHAFDCLIANLYDFSGALAGAQAHEAIVEQIDIGGVALLRAAAKNHAHVAVVAHPDAYADCLAHVRAHQGCTTAAYRLRAAARVFSDLAVLDAQIGAYLAKRSEELGEAGPVTPPDAPAVFPESQSVRLSRTHILRYGENPHQMAAAYADSKAPSGLFLAQKWQGKTLSYNNFLDADAAWRIARSFQETTVAIVKHNNPCGVATHADPIEAYRLAYAADPTSAFGGVIACNRPLEKAWLSAVIEQQFVEVIIGIGPPLLSAEELGALLAHKPHVRVLSIPTDAVPNTVDWRTISGGWLVQTTDALDNTRNDWRVPTRRQPDSREWEDACFAWTVCRFVKSNAIVYAAGLKTLGIGAGQMSRVASARIARDQAQRFGFSLHGAAMASDAFFPFPDSLEEAAAAGVSTVIQPGGSIRDPEVVAAADRLGLAMICTGFRHFCH